MAHGVRIMDASNVSELNCLAKSRCDRPSEQIEESGGAEKEVEFTVIEALVAKLGV